MDPITLNLRVGRTPAASDPIGGELSAAEIDANFTNLKTAAEQLASEKVATADLVTVDNTVTPTAGDKLILIRGSAFYQALVDSLIGGSSSADPLKAWDDWVETRFPVATSPQVGLAGAAISSGTTINSSQLITYADGYWSNGVMIASSTTANSGYRWQGSHSAIRFGSKTHKSRTVYRPITLANTTVRTGFHDTTTSAEPTDGVWFDIIAGVVTGCARANSTKYTTATTYTLTVNQVYILDLDVSADGTLATYSVLDGITEEVLWTDTVANGIPTTTARMTNQGLIATCSTTTSTTIGIFYLFGFGTVAGFNKAMGIVPVVPTAPAAFSSGDWTLTPGVTSAVVNITALPSDGNSAITALEYRIDGGSAVALSGTGTGSRTVSGLTAGVAVDIEIRAVNAVGNGAWSDVKSATPTAGGGSVAMTGGVHAGPSSYGTTLSVPIPSGMQAGDSMAIMVYGGSAFSSMSAGTWYDRTPASWSGDGIRLLVSDPFASVPGAALTATFGGSFNYEAAVYSITGVSSAAALGSATGSTGYAAGARDHAYTTTAANSVAIGYIYFDGGGVTGVGSADAAHTWDLNASNGYNNSFSGVRASSGSYAASLAPVGGSSASYYGWAELGAA